MSERELLPAERSALENTLLQGEKVVWFGRPRQRALHIFRWFKAPRLYVLTNFRALVLDDKSCLCYPRSRDMIYDFIKHSDGTVSIALGPDWERSCGKKIAVRGFMHLAADEWKTAYDLMRRNPE